MPALLTLARAFMMPSRALRLETDHWDSYLEQFHRERPGITQVVLGKSFGLEHHDDPYQWLLEALPDAGPVLDLACGNASLFAKRAWSGWIGLDRSRSELGAVNETTSDPLVCADSAQLPLSDGSIGALVCSMGMMVLQPLEETLEEVRRVLAAGATGCLLLPARTPLRVFDKMRYARLLLALRRPRLDYPNDRAMSQLPEVLKRFSLTVRADHRRCFRYSFDGLDSVEQFVDSLYLPGASLGQIENGRGVAKHWIGSTIGIPLRRVVFERI